MTSHHLERCHLVAHSQTQVEKSATGSAQLGRGSCSSDLRMGPRIQAKGTFPAAQAVQPGWAQPGWLSKITAAASCMPTEIWRRDQGADNVWLLNSLWWLGLGPFLATNEETNRQQELLIPSITAGEKPSETPSCQGRCRSCCWSPLAPGIFGGGQPVCVQRR